MLTREYFLGKAEDAATFILMAEALTRTLIPDPAAAQDLIGEAIVQNDQNGPIAGWSMNDPMGKAAMIARYAFREGAAAGAMANEELPEGFEEQLKAMLDKAAKGAGDEPEEAGAVEEAAGDPDGHMTLPKDSKFITSEEVELIDIYRSVNERGKDWILDNARMLTRLPEYRNE